MNIIKPRLSAVVTLLALLLSSTAHAAVMTIINTDGANEGFNDSASRTPVGGNTGTTLGEQRLIAFQAAADQVGSRINSGVAITIEASFDPDFCVTGSATLGFAGPNSAEQNFPNAPLLNILYPQALVNALTGNDRLPGTADISASFNSSIDGNCLGGGTIWYYGVDGNPPGNQIDLLGTVAHELIHGLGFISLINEATGQLCCGNPNPAIFDVFIKDLDANNTWNQMNASQRRSSATNTGRVVWNGPGTTANGAASLSTGTAIDTNDGNKPKVLLYAPNSIESGSSISHWDQDLTPDALMEPSDNGYNLLTRKLGLATCQLLDIGWTLETGINCPDVPGVGPTLTATPTSHSFSTVIIGTSETRNFVLSNTGDQTLNISGVTVTAGAFRINPSEDSCSGTSIPVSGSACNFNVTFTPTDSNQQFADITVTSNAPDSPLQLPVSGQGQIAPAPAISASPASHNFGQRPVGSNNNQVISISNSGNADLIIGNITSTGATFSVLNDTCSNQTLAAAASCTLTARFTPVDSSSSNGSISVASNDADDPTLVINLSGFGAPPPAPIINIESAGIDFGQVDVAASASLPVTLSNSGDADLIIEQLTVNDSNYSISNDGCSHQTVPASGSCSFTANFSPTSTGTINGTITVPSNADGSTDYHISLNGVGVQDEDGIPASVEREVPNGPECAPGRGDANCDEIGDSQQTNVASFRDSNGNFVSLVTNAGKLVNVQTPGNPAPDSTPAGVTFNHGFFSFNVDCGGSCPIPVQVTLTLNNSNTPNSYFKYGPRPANTTNQFYQFSTGTPGASINGNVVTLNLVDGGIGDSDLALNGIIVDPGAPATAGDPSLTESSSGGGGGGCALTEMKRPFDPLIPLLLILSAFTITLRRQSARQCDSTLPTM